MDARNPKRNVSDVFAVARPGAVFPPTVTIDFCFWTQKPGHWFLQRFFNYIFFLSFNSLQVWPFFPEKNCFYTVRTPIKTICRHFSPDFILSSRKPSTKIVLKIIKNIIIFRWFYYSSAIPQRLRPKIFGDISQGNCKCDVIFKLIQINIVENLMTTIF